MKEFCFETFNVQEGNRTAYEACREIAALRYRGASPVVLLGMPGVGKSHLLWSVVKHIRARPVKVGLGLVLAHEFPEKVRQLIQNPAPIQQSRNAVLLVDELEQFRENAADLEKVVELFHQNHHVVVLASNVHPDRLDVFSTAFKILLGKGRLLEMGNAPPPVPAAAPTPALETQGDIAALQSEVETLRWERFELERKMTDKVTEAVNARKAEFEVLRGELEEAREDAASALAEQARLQGLLGAKQSVEESFRNLQKERDVLRAELRQVTEEKERIEAQCAAHEAALRQAREFSVAENGDDAASSSARRRLEMELAEARTLAEAFQAQLEQDHRQVSVEVAQIQAERDMLNDLLEEARAEQGRISVMLDAMRGRMGVMETELEKARKHLSAQTAEMDALRHSAAAQVASASIQAGEMENRAARFESILDAARQTSRATEASVQRISEELIHTVETLKGIARRHALFKGAALEPYGGEGNAALTQDQIPLFDAALLEPSATENFADAPDPFGTPPSSSRLLLNEMVERALYPDDPNEL